MLMVTFSIAHIHTPCDHTCAYGNIGEKHAHSRSQIYTHVCDQTCAYGNIGEEHAYINTHICGRTYTHTLRLHLRLYGDIGEEGEGAAEPEPEPAEEEEEEEEGGGRGPKIEAPIDYSRKYLSYMVASSGELA